MVSQSHRPLFGSTDLAARIERAECELLIAGAESAQRRDPGAGVLVRPIAGGVATWAGSSSPLDKLAGLGFAGAADEGELEEIERAFAARGTRLQIELSNLCDPAVSTALSRRGYALVGFENVLGLRLEEEAPGHVAEGVEVAEIGGEESEAWLDAVVDGFAHPDSQGVATQETFPRDAVERAIGDLVSADGFRRYLARRAGVAAGGASMRIGGGLAQLTGAATRPEHRRKGVQGSLLAFRLDEARRAGCDLAVVSTQPGSKSQENVQRLGFALLYTRAVLVHAGEALAVG